MSAVCFDDIIGLSRTECECYPEIDSTTSHSGLYLDEFIPLEKFASLLNCQNNNDIWEVMDRLRDQATKTFISDANAMMLKYFKPKRPPFTGGIGRVLRKRLTTGMVAGRRYGAWLYCANIVGGEMVVNSIGGMFGSNGNLVVTIYDNIGNEHGSVTIPLEYGKHITKVANITLPMSSNYIENLQYFFTYEYGSLVPYDNDIKCNCGSFKPYFNTIRPLFGMRSEAAYQWNNYVMVGGYSGDGDYFNPPTSAGNKMYGLTLDVTFRCNTSDVICSNYLDFDTNPLANTMAFCVVYKACELAFARFVNNTNINRDALVDGDTNIDGMRMYSRKYTDLLKYIIENINYRVNDCLDCRSFIEVAKSGILA